MQTNFPEQTFLFSVGQLGLWLVAPSHMGGHGAACPASRAGSGHSVLTAPSSRGHVRWFYCAGLHCRHGWCSSMLCHFAAASVDRNTLPSLGNVHAPQGTSLQGHTTRDRLPGTAPAAQRTAARAGPEGSGSMQWCGSLPSSSRFMPSCSKTSNQPAAGLKGCDTVGDQGHPPAVSIRAFSLPPSPASREVSAGSGCSISVVPSL